MEVLTEKTARERRVELVEKIQEGVLFIHPTDTIYGIGCNALDEKAVAKLREARERPTSPLSIWVPSLDWVKENCVVEGKAQEWIDKLPGPYTIIVPMKENVVAKNVAPGLDKVGIRFPNHWFSEIVTLCDLPIVTTSANKAGEKFMTVLDNLDPDIEKAVEFMVYEGEKEGRPSKIIHCDPDRIIER